MTYHPDFGGVGDPAVLLEHPLVVGEKQLEAEPEGEDEGEPQQSAEDQRRQHGLTLSAERHVETGQREKNNYCLWKLNTKQYVSQKNQQFFRHVFILQGGESRSTINI